jgi:hypothetical protein
MIRAVDPVEQLLLTLYTGMPVMPMSYSARCPHVESPEIQMYQNYAITGISNNLQLFILDGSAMHSNKNALS